MNTAKRVLWIALFVVHAFSAKIHGGAMDLIVGTSGGVGFVPLIAMIQQVVTLRLEDSASGGGNLVSLEGINFGNVNNLGTTTEPGVTGDHVGNVGHYEAEFTLSTARSGQGNITLECRRSSAGNFNAHNGVEIDDHLGKLRPLGALQSSVLVLSNVPPGSYDKTVAINIYPNDKGKMNTVLQFTLCAL